MLNASAALKLFTSRWIEAGPVGRRGLVRGSRKFWILYNLDFLKPAWAAEDVEVLLNEEVQSLR